MLLMFSADFIYSVSDPDRPFGVFEVQSVEGVRKRKSGWKWTLQVDKKFPEK